MSNRERLEKLLLRYSGLPASSRHLLLETITTAAHGTADDMIKLEEVMSAKRDWLDGHRSDARFERRYHRYMMTEVREHAAMGEALERYGEIIGERSFGRQDVGATVNRAVGAPVLPDSGEGAPGRLPGRPDQATDGVARTEPERSTPRQTGFDSLQARLRAERIGR